MRVKYGLSDLICGIGVAAQAGGIFLVSTSMLLYALNLKVFHALAIIGIGGCIGGGFILAGWIIFSMPRNR